MMHVASRIGHGWLLFLVLILGTGAAARGPRSILPPVEGDFEPSWFLVQLDRPISEAAADGSFSLETGLPTVDALIRENGIWRIENALPVSSRAPADPESFRRYGFDRTYKFFVLAGADIPELVNRFARTEGVRLAEPDYLLEPAQVYPNDPLFDAQWGLHQSSDCDVDAPEAWAVSVGGPVIVATIDTGADLDHPDLVNQFWSNPGEIPDNGIDDDGNGHIDDVHGWNFTDDSPDVGDQDAAGHGTHVASIIAADTDNTEGIAGVCWNCRLMPLAVASVASSAFADGMVYGTDQGVRVFNISQGRTASSQLTLNGVGYAYDAGVVLAAATGNGAPLGGPVHYPAGYLETIGVGASNLADSYMFWSNYGPEMDVLAPGVSIPAADVGGGYGTYDGTSYASPVVAGLLGIIETLNPAVGREEARHLVNAGADDKGDPGFDELHGWGRVNMHRTLQGAVSSTTLRVDGKLTTRVYFAEANPLAESWDFVRGDLAALSENHLGVDLGDLLCLENDSADPDTAGSEDVGTPARGEAFFYVARFNGTPGAGSYGGSSRNRDREVVSDRTTHSWSADGGQETAWYGESNAAGDVNGDGFDDLVVGAYRYDGDIVNEGAVYLYLGSESGLAATPHWMSTGGQSDAHYGWATATAGDVNCDGYDDVIVGAYHYDNGSTDEGAAFVYYGGPSGLSATPDWTVEADQAGAQLGQWVGSAGDVNADGCDDVMIGADTYDGGEVDEGAVFIYYGSSSGPSLTPDWTAESNQADAYMTLVFNRVGDLNGDGIDDVAVGSPAYDNGQTDEGRVFVHYGSTSGPSAVADLEIEIDVAGAWFGTLVSGAGDVDGDGIDDLLVGAPYYSNGEDSEGAVFVFLGTPTGLSPSYSWSFESNQRGAELGWAGGTAGDVDSDGFDDVIVGAWGYDGHRTDDGRVWVIQGSASGLSAQASWFMSGGQSGTQLGGWTFRAGDVNGDLYDDVVLGAPGFNHEYWNEGRAYVVHGPLTRSEPIDCPK